MLHRTLNEMAVCNDIGQLQGAAGVLKDLAVKARTLGNRLHIEVNEIFPDNVLPVVHPHIGRHSVVVIKRSIAALSENFHCTHRQATAHESLYHLHR